MASRTLIIATRNSPLALQQAYFVQRRLQVYYLDRTITLLPIVTQGDRNTDTALDKIGGKGLFVKELELALQQGHADLAVHSLKDVPMVLPQGFTLAAVCNREDPRDVFVSNTLASLAQAPPNSIIGTSSLRRKVQLHAKFPQLQVKPLRGNIHSRLMKLDAGEYDGIILAAAGLVRLGLTQRIQEYISLDDLLPAPGQGMLGIEIRSDHAELWASLPTVLGDPISEACATAERTLSRRLNGSCRLPLGAYCEEIDGILRLRAVLGLPDGSHLVRAQAVGSSRLPETLGLAVAEQILSRGGQAILDSLHI